MIWEPSVLFITWSYSINSPFILFLAFRSVHTPENLGIPKYNEERARTSSQYTSDVILGRFKSRMAQQAQPEARGCFL